MPFDKKKYTFNLHTTWKSEISSAKKHIEINTASIHGHNLMKYLGNCVSWHHLVWFVPVI